MSAPERPGTGCFYAEVDDRVACTVHCSFFPCMHRGEPASDVPVHMGSEHFPRAVLLQHWRDTTGGQRPLVLHRGDIAGGAHLVDIAADCWCAPECIGADPVIV